MLDDLHSILKLDTQMVLTSAKHVKNKMVG